MVAEVSAREAGARAFNALRCDAEPDSTNPAESRPRPRALCWSANNEHWARGVSGDACRDGAKEEALDCVHPLRADDDEVKCA